MIVTGSIAGTGAVKTGTTKTSKGKDRAWKMQEVELNVGTDVIKASAFNSIVDSLSILPNGGKGCHIQAVVTFQISAQGYQNISLSAFSLLQTAPGTQPSSPFTNGQQQSSTETTSSVIGSTPFSGGQQTDGSSVSSNPFKQ